MAIDSTAANGAMDSIVSANTIDDTTRLIVEQADLPPNPRWHKLRKTRDAIKVTARTWRLDGRPTLFNIAYGFIAYNNQFEAFYSVLRGYATRFNSDTQAVLSFVAAIDELKSEISSHRDEANVAVDKLTAFFSNMTNHKLVIDNECEDINKTFLGKEGILEMRKLRIENLDADINKLNKEVQESSANFSKLLDERRKEEMRLIELQRIVNQTFELQNNVHSLFADIRQVLAAVEPLTSAWVQLDNDYQFVTRKLQSSSNEGQRARKEISDKLAIANEQWQAISRRANSIRRNELTSRTDSERNGH